MSDSFYVIGIKPPDEKWKQMKAIWDACEGAGIQPPEEVEDFFGDEKPDNKGVKITLGACYELGRDEGKQNQYGASYYDGDMEEGIEIEVAKLPPDIKILRFYNSY
jgi:hypothetical protein